MDSLKDHTFPRAHYYLTTALGRMNQSLFDSIYPECFYKNFNIRFIHKYWLLY